MKEEDYFFLGYLSKKHGYKGELNLKFNSISSRHEELNHIFLTINKSKIPFYIEHLRMKKNDTAIIKLEGIDHDDEADFLIGKKVYTDILISEQALSETITLIGYDVIDSKLGHIGKISDIIHNNSQEIFQIKNDDKEILIPVTKQFIQKIKNNTLYLKTPNGLIDLYLKS